MRRPSLRARVALGFGLASIIVLAVVGGVIQHVLVTYLIDEREKGALSRATGTVIEADRLSEAGLPPREVLGEVRNPALAQQFLRIDGRWYAANSAVSPDVVPDSLAREARESGAAAQRFLVGDEIYLGMAIQYDDTILIDVQTIEYLADAAEYLRFTIAIGVVVAGALGLAIGLLAMRGVLRPLRQVAAGADALGRGDLDRRIGHTGDRDLDPIAARFDAMADSVQTRILRERRFVVNVSHELRTPVTVVLGAASVLAGRTQYMDASSAELVNAMESRLAALSDTLQELLELGAIVPGTTVQREEVDLAALAERVLTHSGLSADLVVREGDTVAISDASRLSQIIGNLVDNAELHGGGVTSIEVIGRDGAVSVAVNDGGPGVPKDERGTVFELFGRGSGAVPGTGSGIGLTIVAELAELLDATVQVEDSENDGARFVVRLPARLNDELEPTGRRSDQPAVDATTR